MKARKIPVQKTSRERSPQINAGRRKLSFKAGESRGINRATINANERK